MSDLRFERVHPAPDPREVAIRLAALPWFIWLDSTADHQHLGRWSFMMADPAVMLRADDVTTYRRERGGRWTVVDGDILTVLGREMAGRQVTAPDDAPPFVGGAAGFITYDWGRVLERRPRAAWDDLQVPGAMFGIYDGVYAWDHQRGEMWVLGEPVIADSADRAVRESERTAMTAMTAMTTAPSYPVLSLEHAESIGLRSTFTHRGYQSAVQRVREYILAGDIFQANLSQRFEAPLGEAPFDFYHRLRRQNPAPFGAYIACDDFIALSVSPERFLKLEGRAIETRPIKGTRPRGLGPMHDQALGRELTESDKDRAENVMIVDLLRNDLSRVSRPGTVRVPELFSLEQHPTVHHLVSTVTGELADTHGAADLLRAAFPGGSITGAPKVRAMEIIAELEPTERGLYCGAIGYISAHGTMDTNIAIRTCVVRGDRLYFSGGGGIVADSDPELEYRETLHKVQGIVRTLAQLP